MITFIIEGHINGVGGATKSDRIARAKSYEQHWVDKTVRLPRPVKGFTHGTVRYLVAVPRAEMAFKVEGQSTAHPHPFRAVVRAGSMGLGTYSLISLTIVDA